MTTATLPSRTSSQQYTVCLNDDGSATCTCVAGSFNKPCWHVKLLRAEAERRNAGELETLNAQIDAMGERISEYGHVMPVAAFSALQRRYWTARERRAELIDIPLLG
jgi:hypothetical protein